MMNILKACRYHSLSSLSDFLSVQISEEIANRDIAMLWKVFATIIQCDRPLGQERNLLKQKENLLPFSEICGWKERSPWAFSLLLCKHNIFIVIFIARFRRILLHSVTPQLAWCGSFFSLISLSPLGREIFAYIKFMQNILSAKIVFLALPRSLECITNLKTSWKERHIWMLTPSL